MHLNCELARGVVRGAPPIGWLPASSNPAARVLKSVRLDLYDAVNTFPKPQRA